MATIKQIIIAHYTLPPVTGGVENMLVPLSEVFANQGYHVTLLSGKGHIEGKNIKTSIIPELNPDNISIKNFQKILSIGSLPESYELKVKDFERKIETQVGDINDIIIHNIMTMPFNLIATEAFWNYITRNPHKNFYIWVHDLAWLIESHKNRLFRRHPWTLLKENNPNIKYITISNFRKRQVIDLMKVHRNKISVVPNVLKYQDFLKFCPESALVISHLSLFTKSPFILIPARIIHRKNIERSIEIIAQLQHKFPDILAIITGPPNTEDEQLHSYYQMLCDQIEKHQLQEKVIFLHNVFSKLGIPPEKNRQVVHDLYFVSNLVLFLSKDEGFGLPILEAGASRSPIALSNLPVFREIAGENALFLPENESLTANINRISKLLVENQSKSEALLKRVFSRFNWNSYWKDHLQKIFEK